MLDARNRAEHYRDLAEECRRRAITTLSSRMKERYLLVAKDYLLLADGMEQAHFIERAVEGSKHCIESSRLLMAQLDRLQAFENSD